MKALPSPELCITSLTLVHTHPTAFIPSWKRYGSTFQRHPIGTSYSHILQQTKEFSGWGICSIWTCQLSRWSTFFTFQLKKKKKLFPHSIPKLDFTGQCRGLKLLANLWCMKQRSLLTYPKKSRYFSADYSIFMQKETKRDSAEWQLSAWALKPNWSGTEFLLCWQHDSGQVT